MEGLNINSVLSFLRIILVIAYIFVESACSHESLERFIYREAQRSINDNAEEMIVDFCDMNIQWDSLYYFSEYLYEDDKIADTQDVKKEFLSDIVENNSLLANIEYNTLFSMLVLKYERKIVFHEEWYFYYEKYSSPVYLMSRKQYVVKGRDSSKFALFPLKEAYILVDLYELDDEIRNHIEELKSNNTPLFLQFSLW